MLILREKTLGEKNSMRDDEHTVRIISHGIETIAGTRRVTQDVFAAGRLKRRNVTCPNVLLLGLPSFHLGAKFTYSTVFTPPTKRTKCMKHSLTSHHITLAFFCHITPTCQQVCCCGNRAALIDAEVSQQNIIYLLEFRDRTSFVYSPDCAKTMRDNDSRSLPHAHQLVEGPLYQPLGLHVWRRRRLVK